MSEPIVAELFQDAARVLLAPLLPTLPVTHTLCVVADQRVRGAEATTRRRARGRRRRSLCVDKTA